MEDLTVSGAWYKGERNTYMILYQGKKLLDFTQLAREGWKEQPLRVFANNALELKSDLNASILH